MQNKIQNKMQCNATQRKTVAATMATNGFSVYVLLNFENKCLWYHHSYIRYSMRNCQLQPG